MANEHSTKRLTRQGDVVDLNELLRLFDERSRFRGFPDRQLQLEEAKRQLYDLLRPLSSVREDA